MRIRIPLPLVGIVLATAGIIGLAVWQQQKRLPELEAKRPQPRESIPPGLTNLAGGKDGERQASPLEFAALYENLKPEKKACFEELWGKERLQEVLAQPSFVPTGEDTGVIGECLFRGVTMESTPPTEGNAKEPPAEDFLPEVAPAR